MSNIIPFQSKQNRTERHEPSVDVDAVFSAPAKVARLQSNAKDAFTVLANQLEAAVQHARAIEPKMRDRGTRQAFGERIEIVERLLDIARVKILQL